MASKHPPQKNPKNGAGFSWKILPEVPGSLPWKPSVAKGWRARKFQVFGAAALNPKLQVFHPRGKTAGMGGSGRGVRRGLGWAHSRAHHALI